MKLISIEIQKFRNIINSETIELEPEITCLVGKNESGKTALLHSLYRLFPARSNVSFSIPDQYPAWLEKKDRLRGDNLERVEPITATFQLDDDDITLLAESFGEGIITQKSTIKLSREYSNELNFNLDVSELAFVKHVIKSIEWPHGTKTEANKLKTIEELQEHAEKLASNEDDAENQTLGKNITQEINSRLGNENLTKAVWEKLIERVPKVLYFSEYSSLPYSVKIERLLKTKTENLDDNEITAQSFLRLAAADDEYLTNPDYERRKRELENVANAITQDVLKYWSQNPELRVQPDITQKTITDNQGRHSVVDELKIRIWDQRHQLSLPFDEHSTGFRWFFSFLVAFSEYEYRSEPLIILLDEPALGLHARAQKDFLQFIEERLAPKNQVIYTTHSPFMVQPGKLERVRLIEDKGQLEGTKVTAEVTTTDPDTLFPLQGALGYDLGVALLHNS